MIVGREVVEKLDNLPERGKGQYVSEAIMEKIQREQSPITEERVREICREEMRNQK